MTRSRDLADLIGSSGLAITGDIVLGDNNPTITMNDSSVVDLQHLIVSSSNNLILAADNNNVDAGTKIQFYVDGTEHMLINSSGDVGIGTTAPKQKVHSTNGFYTTGGIASPGTPPYTSYSGASFDWFDGYARFYSWGADATTRGGYSFIQLQSDGESQQTAMTIDASGYVGIGTNSPGVELDIKRIANTYPLRIQSVGGEGRAIVFADVQTTPTKYNWIAGAQYNTNNAFEITPSTAVGGYTFSTPAITVLETGNVGIGTTTPGYNLHVEKLSASANVDLLVKNTGTDGTSNTRIMSYVSGASGGDPKIGLGITGVRDYFWRIDNSDSDKLILDTNGADIFTIDTSGNVGIGEPSPGEKLVIKGTTSFMATNSTNRWMAYTYTDNTFRLNYNGSGADEVTIDSSGNVGIGTENPASLLSIQGDGVVSRMDGTANTSRTLLFRSVGTAEGIVQTDGNMHLLQEDANRYMRFSTANTERMRIDASGNVGIGTDSPDSKLDVEADEDTWLARIYNTGSDANAQGLLVRSDATAAHDAPVMGVYADGGYKMLVKSTGNVGIGTTNPSTALDVAGDVTIGSARVSLPYLASKKIGPLSAVATQAKRFTIGRIYYTPAHWSGLWTAVRLNCQMTSYTQGSVEYVIYGYYSSTANDPLQIYVNEITGRNDGSAVPHKFKISLGSQIDSGWDHPSSGDVFYQDIYVDVDYYNSWTIEATVDSDVFSNTNAVSGDEWKVVLYDSPASVNINTFSDTKTVFKNYAVEFNGGLTSGAITSSGTVTATGYLRTSSNGIYGKMADEWHTANALRGGNFSADIGNDTTVLKLFPASQNDESGNVRAANDYSTGIGFMHLDPDNGGWGNGYQGAQAWTGLKLESTPGQEFSSFVIATNASSTAGTFPTERLTVSKEGRVTINNVNDAYNFKAMAGDVDSWFGVYDDANNSANIIVTRSDGATSFQHLGHTGATTIDGTLSSGAITTTGLVSVLTSSAANGTGDLKIIPSLQDSSGVGFAGQVIGVNIKNSVNTSNKPEQDSTWGGVTGATAIALQADDNTYGQFQIWTSPQNSTASTDLIPRFWIYGDGAATFAGDITAASYEFNSNSIFYGKIGVASGPSFFYTGTNTPGSFWDINNLSNGNLIMTLSDAGAMSIAGTLTQSASDERLKENIQPITNALEKLNLLRGVEFDWKDNIEGFSPEQKHETGVIAQEVEKVMPDAVVPAPFNKEYKTVHKDKLIALLIEAVKELQQEVELLKNNS